MTIRADSICVHGDSFGAVQMVARVRHAPADAGLTADALS